MLPERYIMERYMYVYNSLFDFFRFEFYGIYRKLLLLALKMTSTKKKSSTNSIDSEDSLEFNSKELYYQLKMLSLT